MGGGVGARVVHGTIAAAAVVLATAASAVDNGDKLHLKFTPILFYAVPVSLPLPPLSSLSGACGCMDRSSLSVLYSRILPSKKCEALSFASAPSCIPPPGANAGKGQSFDSYLPQESSDVYVPQEATSFPSTLLVSSRRVFQHLLPADDAASVAPQGGKVHSKMFPASNHVTLPASGPVFSTTLGFCAAPVTKKQVAVYLQGWKPYMSVLQLSTEPPLTPTNLRTCITKVQCSIHLESLVSTLSSFQYSLWNHSSQPSKTFCARHDEIEGIFEPDMNGDDLDSLLI